ncbi:MAG: hypothetical protein ACK5QE_08125 [Sphingobacteriia bacterium]
MQNYYLLKFIWGLISIPILTFIVGSVAMKALRLLHNGAPKSPKDVTELFFRLLLGTILSLIFYAFWRKGLNTIMLGFILTVSLSITAYLIFERRKEGIAPVYATLGRKHGLALGISYLAILCFYFFSVLGSMSTSPFKNINPDHGLFGQIGRNITEGYPENYFPSYSRLEPDQYGNTMYHFVESWSSAALSDLSGFSPVAALEVFHRGWFLFLSLLGILSVLMMDKTARISVWLIFLGTMFLLAYTLPFASSILPEKYQGGIDITSAFTRPSYLAKIVYLGPIFLALVILFQGGYRLVAASISTGAIFLSGGLFVWPFPFAILSIFRQTRSENRFYFLIFLILSVAINFLFYYQFYHYTGHKFTKSGEYYETSLSSIYTEVLSEFGPDFFLGFLKTLLTSSAQVAIVIFPVFVILAIYISGRIRKLLKERIKPSDAFILLALLILLSAPVSLLLKNFIKGDAAQILGLTYSLIYLYVVIKVLKITSNASGRFLMFCVTLLAVFELYYSALIHRQSIIYVGTKILNTSLSHSFMEEIAAQDKHSDVGAFIQDTSGQRVANSAYARNYKNFFIHELQVQNNYCGFVSIYDDDVPWDPKDPLQDFVKESLFYLNYKKRPENAGLSKEEVRLKFLREYKIDWIVTDPNMELPPYLEKYRRKEICDGNTGFCIHYLDLTELLNES